MTVPAAGFVIYRNGQPNGPRGPMLTFRGDSDAHIVRGLIAIRAGPRSAKPGSLLLLRQEGIAEMSLCKDVLSLQTEQPLVHPQSTAHQQGRPSHTGGHAGPA